MVACQSYKTSQFLQAAILAINVINTFFLIGIIFLEGTVYLSNDMLQGRNFYKTFKLPPFTPLLKWEETLSSLIKTVTTIIIGFGGGIISIVIMYLKVN